MSSVANTTDKGPSWYTPEQLELRDRGLRILARMVALACLKGQTMAHGEDSRPISLERTGWGGAGAP